MEVTTSYNGGFYLVNRILWNTDATQKKVKWWRKDPQANNESSLVEMSLAEFLEMRYQIKLTQEEQKMPLLVHD